MELDRRTFIKGAALSGALAATAGLAACSPAQSGESDGGQTGASDAGAGQQSGDWRAAPEPIADIAETVDADVVVVGAGTSGCFATLAAVEAGAKTVCLQKGSMVMTHGAVFGAIGSRWQQEAGYEYDINEMANAHARYNSLRPDIRFLKSIMAESAKTLEWIADETGTDFELVVKGGNHYEYDQPVFMTGHRTTADKAIGLATQIADLATSKGAEFYFDTPGVQLVSEDGRVTGVVGQREDGSYVQFNAAKGVILSTGDYGSDYAMCADLCPWVVGTNNYYNPPYNTGDGHKMGTWVGAKMETPPHTKMAHVHSCIDGTNLTDSPMRTDPFLWVNQNGERFCNEDMEYGMICNIVSEQPGDVYYIVCDATYADQRKTRRNPGADIKQEAVDKAVELGYWITADTLEEAAEAWEIPAEALKETVARYNELAEAGVDEDYGKPAADLGPIAQGPFHIVRVYTPMDVTMGGLMVNGNMQVLDEDDAVIEGLYATGNTQGGFYGATDYDLEVDGFSLGRAATSGRLAGEHAAR